MNNDLEIKLGQLIGVENKNKRNLENESYIALQIEDQDGNNERCILFTEIEISDIKTVSIENWFCEHMKIGRLYLTTIGKRSFYLIKVYNIHEEVKIIRLSKRVLNKATKRALNNPEDLTKKSFLTDIFD